MTGFLEKLAATISGSRNTPTELTVAVAEYLVCGRRRPLTTSSGRVVYVLTCSDMNLMARCTGYRGRCCPLVGGKLVLFLDRRITVHGTGIISPAGLSIPRTRSPRCGSRLRGLSGGGGDGPAGRLGWIPPAPDRTGKGPAQTGSRARRRCRCRALTGADQRAAAVQRSRRPRPHARWPIPGGPARGRRHVRSGAPRSAAADNGTFSMTHAMESGQSGHDR